MQMTVNETQKASLREGGRQEEVSASGAREHPRPVNP